MTSNLPLGYTLKFVLFNTWWDPHYIGLNGIEIYDHTGDPILSKFKHPFIISADPSSVNITSLS